MSFILRLSHMVVQMFVGLFVSQLDTNVGCSPARLWQSTERIIGLVFKFLLRKDLLLWGDLDTRFFLQCQTSLLLSYSSVSHLKPEHINSLSANID